MMISCLSPPCLLNTPTFIYLYIYIPQEYLGKSLYWFMWVLVMELSIGLYNSVYDLSRASIWVIYESLVWDLEKNNYEGFRQQDTSGPSVNSEDLAYQIFRIMKVDIGSINLRNWLALGLGSEEEIWFYWYFQEDCSN